MTRGVIKEHYEREDPGRGPAIDGDEGDLYEKLRRELAEAREGEVDRIKELLGPANDEAAGAAQQAAPRGPYYRVCPRGGQPDAVATLCQHSDEVVAAVTNRECFPSASEQEAAFWQSIGR